MGGEMCADAFQTGNIPLRSRWVELTEIASG